MISSAFNILDDVSFATQMSSYSYAGGNFSYCRPDFENKLYPYIVNYYPDFEIVNNDKIIESMDVFNEIDLDLSNKISKDYITLNNVIKYDIDHQIMKQISEYSKIKYWGTHLKYSFMARIDGTCVCYDNVFFNNITY